MPESDSERGFALSWQQRRLWRLARADAAAGASVFAEARIRGELDDARFLDCLRQAFASHECYRIRVRQIPGLDVPLQCIEENDGGQRASLEAFDVSGLAPAPREARLQEIADTLRRHRFEPDANVVAKGALARIRPEERRLMLGVSGYLADAESLRLLLRQACQLYDSQPAASESEALAYIDYSEWQAGLLKSEEGQEGRAFWAKRLQSLEASRRISRFERLSEAGADRGRTRLPALDGLDASELETRLRALWGAFLCKHLDAESVVFLCRSPGRSMQELAAMIGPVARYLPLSASAEPTSDLDAMARSLGEQARRGERYQECFDWTADAGIEAECGAFGFSFFDLRETLRCAGSTADVVELNEVGEGKKLSLSAWARGDRLEMAFDFDRGRFDDRAVASLAEQFARLLRDRLGLAPSSARPRPTEPEAFAPPGWDFHERFEAVAARQPDEVAVVSDEKPLSYRELNELANALSAKLIRHPSWRRGAVAGLWLERADEFLIAMLAVLKSGGAYLPLELATPKERVDYMLGDSGAVLAITGAATAEFPSSSSVPVVSLDRSELAGEKANPDIAVGLDGLAYVIYTSGSTGRPKGVGIERRQAVSYTRAALDRLGIRERLSFATLSSFATDLGNTSIFCSLLSGGCLHVLGRQAGLDPQIVSDYFDRWGIDFLKIAPSHFRALAASGRSAATPRKLLVFGGEALQWETVELARGADLSVFNHYGPTETTVGVACGLVDRTGPRYANGVIPIGPPLSHATIEIVDAEGAPVEAGQVGELLIGGHGVARGYINDERQTAEKFQDRPEGRAYRSGDLGYWLPSGEIALIGRRDRQVKINGYRVELGEVESVLTSCPGVVQAAATYRARSDAPSVLIGYVKLAAGCRIESVETAARVALPPHMRPSRYVETRDFPLTASGKIDYAALREPERPTASSGQAPIGEVETLLAEVWRQALRLENVGRDDDFFQLGGDSIAAMQISAKLRSRGVRARVADIFKLRTIAALAAHGAADSQRLAEPEKVVGDAPLLPVQRWFVEASLQRPAHYNQAIALERADRVDPDALRQAFALLAERHDALRAVLSPGGAAMSFSESTAVDLPVVELARDSEKASVLQHSEAMQSGFELESGPLFKLRLFRASDRDLLLVVAHHLVIDGVSWRTLVEELELIYQGIVESAPRALPRTPNSVRQWQEFLLDFAQSSAVLEQLAYWQSVCRSAKDAGAEDTAAKPASNRGVASFSLDPERTRDLLGEAGRRFDCEVDDLLLAAFGRALAALGFAEGATLLMLEGHGREEVAPTLDVSRTVGWLTALYPFSLTLSLDALDVQVSRVKRARSAIPGRGLGYGLLKYYAALSEDARRSLRVRPRIRFNNLGQFDQALSGTRWRKSDWPIAPSIDPVNKTLYAIEIDCMTIDGALAIHIESESDSGAIAREYQKALADLLARPAEKTVASYTDGSLSEEELALIQSAYQS